MHLITDSVLGGMTLLSLEKLIFGFFDKATPDDLFYIIEKNESAVIPPDTLQWVRPIYHKFHDTFDTYTVDYILEKLRKKRPELWSVIKTHPRGREWGEARLGEIRQQLGA